MARDRHGTGLRRMAIDAMTAALALESPTVLLDQLDHIAHLHMLLSD
jgi:hypothetical protein